MIKIITKFKVGDVIKVGVTNLDYRWNGYSIIKLTQKVGNKFRFRIIKHNAEWDWNCDVSTFPYKDESYYKLTEEDLDKLMVEEL